MTDKSPTAEEIAALPEPEFLELDRDCDRISAEYDFKSAGINALGAGGFGSMAAASFLSAAPLGALMGALTATVAGMYVWKAIQDIGKGVQDAAKNASADTALLSSISIKLIRPAQSYRNPKRQVASSRAAHLLSLTSEPDDSRHALYFKTFKHLNN